MRLEDNSQLTLSQMVEEVESKFSINTSKSAIDRAVDWNTVIFIFF